MAGVFPYPRPSGAGIHRAHEHKAYCTRQESLSSNLLPSGGNNISASPAFHLPPFPSAWLLSPSWLTSSVLSHQGRPHFRVALTSAGKLGQAAALQAQDRDRHRAALHTAVQIRHAECQPCFGGFLYIYIEKWAFTFILSPSPKASLHYLLNALSEWSQHSANLFANFFFLSLSVIVQSKIASLTQGVVHDEGDLQAFWCSRGVDLKPATIS